MHHKIEKMKEYVKENKKVYIVGVGGIVVGGIGALIFVPRNIQIVDAMNLKIWSPTTSNVTQIVLERRACREPIPVRCIKTGEPFASINRASKVTGETATAIAKDVHGLAESFERLPDTVLAK